MNGLSAYFQNAIAEIAHHIAQYREDLARINREFDNASVRINQFITGFNTEGIKYGNNLTNMEQLEKKLQQDSNIIELQIKKTQDSIKKRVQDICAAELKKASLERAKLDLERQIAKRSVFDDIFFFFFEDIQKNKCLEMKLQLSAVALNISSLQRTKSEFDAAQFLAEERKTELQKTMEEIRLAKFNWETLKGNRLSAFANQWQKIASEIERAGSRLRCHQLALADLGPNLPVASQMPTQLFLGSQRVYFKISLDEYFCFLPHAIPFPFARALSLPEDNAAQRRMAHHLLLRLLSALPPGQLELTLVDPLKLGQSLEPFLPLLKVEQLVPQQRVLTRSDEIEAALGKLMDDIENIIQHKFNDKASNWTQYNSINAENPLCYKVMAIFDVPEQLSDKSLWFIERLCQNGPRCGILVIIANDGKPLRDRRYEKFWSALRNSTTRLDSLLRGVEGRRDGLSFAYKPEQWPRQDSLDGFISVLAERCAAKSRFSKSMPDLWMNFANCMTTIGGFDIPIGWNPLGETVSLTIGATGSEHHALLAGKTGSGKSNLLHVMIHTLCEKYAPGEVDLYLLDYKESTEFTVYATPPLPHARLVATESDPEYGVTVLRHLADELAKRAGVFKTAGVRDFAEYRNASREQLPRVLLVIDEFQVLFSDRRQVAEEAEQLLSQLLKQGRSFGIHILLATQTLKGINVLSIGAIITQLGCRIALACGQEDSAIILGGNNWAAAELRSPPEGIINNANGAKSGNVKFQIPLAESALCREHISKLSERHANCGEAGKTRVFNGANLPCRPGFGKYRSSCGEANAILLGEKLTFCSDMLTIPLTTRIAFNVLFSGYHDQIHDGLLVSTLASMAANCFFEEIIYFNGRGITPCGSGVSDVAQLLGSRFKSFNETDTLPLQEILDSIGKRRIALIVDGLDSDKSLHPAPAFKLPKPGEPSSPADLLKRIAEEGPRKGTFVFAFIDNWRRCAGPCKDLFGLFELRIAFGMNEDDAGALVSGGIGKFKGIEKPNRAVFVNRMTNDIVWFRPFIQ